jgi:glutathione S-transferase
MIKLYWSPRSRSISAIWLLEESGLPYERVLTDISTGAQKAPDYLAINPMGKVPGLKDGDAALGKRPRSAPILPTAIRKPILRRPPPIRCGRNICSGCSFRQAASSRP